jgi:two-component system, OmpR family, response regulator
LLLQCAMIITKNHNKMKHIKPRLLLVEDDPNLSFVIKEYLEILNYETTVCTDGEAGLEAFNQGKYDLVLLDVMMPKKDGFTVAEEIRKTNDATPIIFLTAKTLKEDRVKGFQSGCDDYITKPFSTEELSLRIKAILKRCMFAQNGFSENSVKTFEIGKYIFDFENLVLKSENIQQPLTRKEGALLKLLCVYKNKLLPREIALKSVWGGDDYFVGRSMDVFIAKLRKYFKDDPDISITNIHGSGFKLEFKEPQTENVL